MYIYWWWGHSPSKQADEGQLLGTWWEDSNKVFRLVNCIQNVKYGTVVDAELELDGGSNWVECI